jgi:nucleoside phosphorylase
MKEPILVTFAVKEEARAFRRATRGQPAIQTRLTGMGAANATRTIRSLLLQTRPAWVITSGFAGALNPDLGLGDVVFECDECPELIPLLLREGARAGRFHCASSIAVSRREKEQLFLQTGADAVEMESQVIRQICLEHAVPSATIRVISDTASEDLPLDFNQCLRPDASLSVPRLLLGLLKAPHRIPRLLRFRERVLLAGTGLGAVLAAVIQDW